MNKKCIVLWSGGVDSTTCLYWAVKAGFSEVIALAIDYGQRNVAETIIPFAHLKQGNVKQVRLQFDLSQIGGSSLLGDSEVPIKNHNLQSTPNTWVPCRNLLLLTLAASYGAPKGVYDYVIGTNVVDNPSYPDTTEEFLVKAENAISSSLNHTVKIHRPLENMSKCEIVELGLRLGVDFSYTISCYQSEIPCIVPKNSKDLPLLKIQKNKTGCSSCLIRAEAFNALGLLDPLLVRLRREGRI